MERFIEAAMRSMSERAELCREMAEKVGSGHAGQESWLAAMREAKDQTAPLRVLLEREWLDPKVDRRETAPVL